MKYSKLTANGAPGVEVKNIVADFSKQLSQSGEFITTSIQSFKIPQLLTFQQPTPINTPTLPPEQPPSGEWLQATIRPAEPPTSTPTQIHPTNITPSSSLPKPTLIPTSIKINPTSPPKPTKVPKPTAVPPMPAWTEDKRPGSSIEEILKEVSKRVCIPYALLMATRTQESGAWMKNLDAKTTELYNTYGWWKTASQGQVCAALAYYTQSGKIPPDSGGGTCTNGVQPDAYDQKIMGLMQVSEQEEQVTRKNTVKTLSKNIDRRVLFDNAVIYAYATKARAGQSPQPSCDDWPQETVKLVAEKHFGACAYGNGKNYCTEVWNLYKSFK